MGSPVSGLQLLGRPGAGDQTPRRAKGPEGDEGTDTGDHVPQWGPQHLTDRDDPAALSRRLARVFSARRYPAGLRAGRAVAPSSPARRPSQTLEARTDRLSRATAARGIAPRGGDGGAIHGQLVASGRPCRPASRSAHVVFRSAWRTTTRHARTSTHRTAGCGPACPVVWEGSRRAILSYSLSRFIGVLLRQSSCDAAPTSPLPSSTPPPHPPPATESTSCPDRSSAPSRHSATT